MRCVRQCVQSPGLVDASCHARVVRPSGSQRAHFLGGEDTPLPLGQFAQRERADGHPHQSQHAQSGGTQIFVAERPLRLVFDTAALRSCVVESSNNLGMHRMDCALRVIIRATTPLWLRTLWGRRWQGLRALLALPVQAPAARHLCRIQSKGLSSSVRSDIFRARPKFMPPLTGLHHFVDDVLQ